MEYNICVNCIMDTSDPEIEFDNSGICNHCIKYETERNKRMVDSSEREIKLNKIIQDIKSKGKKNEYDCLIGVSGGVDSTYVAYLVKQLGLKPLAVHFDNGWNSALAVSNIEKILKKLDIDLYTYVVDWEEFKSLQLSFLKASTPDGEIPTDHAINAILWKTASKYNIKYIITGMNYSTESLAVRKWAYGHSDWKYIIGVHKRFENTKLKTYPHFNFFDLFYYTFVRKIKSVSILNYIDYNKDDVMEILQKQLGWVYYGGKHYESIYTRFYQSYILPTKFKIDKRRGHLSDLIKAGQITRNEALVEIQKKTCPQSIIDEDKLFIIKKLGLTKESLNQIMNAPLKTFEDYPNNYQKVYLLKKIVNYFRLLKLYPK